MISILHIPAITTMLIGLAVMYGIAASISTFYKRLQSIKELGLYPKDEPVLPTWMAEFYRTKWVLWSAMLLINWRFALIALGLEFLLNLSPVLDMLGEFLSLPFRRNPTED